MLFIEEYKENEKTVDDYYKDIIEKYENITALFKNVNKENVEKIASDIESMETNMIIFTTTHCLLLQAMWEEINALNTRTVEFISGADKKEEIEKILKLHKEKERKEERLKIYKLYQEKFDNLLQEVKKIDIEIEKIKDKLIEKGYIKRKGIFAEAYANEFRINEIEAITEAEANLKEEFEQEINY